MSLLEELLAEWRSDPSVAYRDEFVVRYLGPDIRMVFSAGSRPITDEIIRREIEVQLGQEFEWAALSCDSPPDLVDRLVAHGFVKEPLEVVCTYDLNDGMPTTDSDWPVVQVTDERTLADFRSVAEAVSGKDFSFTCRELAEDFGSDVPGEVGFVAYDGETPVSIGRLTHRPGSRFAGLYTGNTLPSHRGRGFYRAVVAARAAFAVQLSANVLTVDARPTSLPTLLRLGFQPQLEMQPCLWRNAKASL